MIPSYRYRAKIVSVYDGDTVRADIDLGCSIWVRNEPLRLFGIDAPELRGDERNEGLRSRDWLRHRVLDRDVIVETIKDKRGKYGRLLAKLWIEDRIDHDDGSTGVIWSSVTAEMVMLKLAVERFY